MSQPPDPIPPDPLIERYRAASDRDPQVPSAALRARIAAQAQVVARERGRRRAPGVARRWFVPAIAAGGVAALVGLMALQTYFREAAVPNAPAEPPLAVTGAGPAARAPPTSSITPTAQSEMSRSAISRPLPSPHSVASSATADRVNPAANVPWAGVGASRAPLPLPAAQPAPVSPTSVAEATASMAAPRVVPTSPAAAAVREREGLQAAPAESGAAQLLEASEGGDVARVKALLAAGVPADVRDVTGRSALLLAVLRGRQAVVPLLLRAGARVDAPDAAGQTPLSVARESADPAMLALLGAPAP